jgi:uncharacterized membrane protein YvlD (DUF360 family)
MLCGKLISDLILAMVAWILPGFSIASFGSAIIGWLIIAITSWIASAIFK